MLNSAYLAQLYQSRAECLGANAPAACAILEFMAIRVTNSSSVPLQDLLNMEAKGSA